ncbi:hypothetical protein HNP86_001875 [Methanococcus maripaludis]|uniref:Uncharacterized protein n=1 Tax=Methanococcus maripaludis TaxID=39152 RepID=A0A7J9P112_METMI|nr:hypothetical protein [Methanococcus maripaludis]MBA2851716.1 hypothetical protein [Methanococcus maripaludis]
MTFIENQAFEYSKEGVMPDEEYIVVGEMLPAPYVDFMVKRISNGAKNADTLKASIDALITALADKADVTLLPLDPDYTEYGYDVDGNIQTVTEKISDVVVRTTTFTYNVNGDMETMVEVNAVTGNTSTTTYVYDESFVLQNKTKVTVPTV